MRATILLLLAILLQNGASAASAGQYGGWEGYRGKSTGFFHVEKSGQRWWLVTPDGYGYYAVATDHVNYQAHWCETLGYAPYHKNCEKKYNGDEKAWATETVRRLKSWNFNSFGAGNCESVRGRGMAYTEFMSMGCDFAGTDSIVERVHWTGFPDVYNPEFARFCEARAKERCEPRKNDPWLLGYFIDNELEWYGKDGSDVGIANEAIKRPASHLGKKALIALLQMRYSTIQEFNKAWQTNMASWDQAAAETSWNEKDSEQVQADKMAYVRDCCERYFAITTAAIRKTDPNHLILGCRFAGRAPGIWDLAGKYCDIVTFNYYGPVDLVQRKPLGLIEDLRKWSSEAKKPMMVTEWSFPALDAGLPSVHGAGMRVRSQKDKANAFEIYQTTFFRLPFMVGSSYFMYIDEPAQGISSTFPEDSNYGLVDVNDNPWKELTEAAARINAQVYAIHSSQIPVLKLAEGSPSLDPITGSIKLVVSNMGGAPASNVPVRITLDGKPFERKLDLRPGETKTLVFGVKAPAGAHQITVHLDPESKLIYTSQGDYATKRALLFRPDGRRKGAVLGIANQTDHSINETLAIPISKLLPNHKSIVPFALADDKGEVPFEILDADLNGKLSSGDTLVVPVALPAGGAQSLRVVAGRSLPAKAFVQAKAVNGYKLTNGTLSLSKSEDGGNPVEQIRMGDLDLGRLEMLICQKTPRSQWISPNQTKEMRLFQGKYLRRLDITAELHPDSGAERKAFAVRCALDIYPNKRWFVARYLSVSNLSREPWTLDSCFYYAISSIAGTQDGDEPGRSGNSRIGAWVDEKMDGAFGVAALPGTQINCNFWKDPSEHADAACEIKHRLQPGETYRCEEMPVLIFGARPSEKPNPYQMLEGEMQALPIWQVFDASVR